MRAVHPTTSGLLRLEGFEVGYETYGDPLRPPVLLVPPWQIVHSRIWKMQIPFLAGFSRVIVFDTPGNGLSERTTDPAAFEYERIVRQILGLLDHLDVVRTSIVAFSRGCDYSILLAATAPERVERMVLIGNGVTRAGWQPKPDPGFWERRQHYDGWQKRNAHYMLEHYDDWLEFFFAQINPEPHSTKQLDDQAAWARDTTPEILVQSVPNGELLPELPAVEAIAMVRCPVLLIHGDDDRCDPIDASYDLTAARPDWELAALEGCGHGVPGRHPVIVNELLRDFLYQGAASYARG